MGYNTALSGLNAATAQLDSISNDIANSGTYGYKESRADFSASYAGAQATGVSIGGSTQSISRGGSITPTGRSMDCAIDGGGFFVTKAPDGTILYTRSGIFGMDSEGYVVDSQGNRVQGYSANPDGSINTGDVGDIKVPTGQIPAMPSSSVDFVCNLDSGATVPVNTTFDPNDSTSYNSTYTTQVYDSLGNAHTVSQYFVKTGDNTWEVHYTVDGTDVGIPPTSLQFDTDGNLISPTGPVTLDLGTPAGASPLSITINYAGTTQYGSEFNVAMNDADGYPSGAMSGVSIDEDGTVYATYSNGQKLAAGQIVLATFVNENGLQATDGTSWTATSASGPALVSAPGTGKAGTIQSGALEASNVDTTAELVNLMVAQQFYQANTQVIATLNQTTQYLMQAIS